METKSSIQKYAELVTVRDAMKPFTQVSWTIKNLEKKADIDSIDPKDYDAVLELYIRLSDEVLEASEKLKQLLKQKNYETKYPLHEN